MAPWTRRAAARGAWLRAGVLFPVVLALSAHLAAPADSRQRFSYLAMVERYAAGDRAEAVAALGRLSERELEAEVRGLRDRALAAERHAAGPETLAVERLPLQAAIMLHTDREEVEQERVLLLDESGAKCGSGVHAGLAAEIAPLLMGRAEGRDFARRWYLAMTLRAHGRYCFDDAWRWAQKGLKWFPKDAELLLASGTTDETVGSLPGWSRSRLEVVTYWRRDEARNAALKQRRHLEYARQSFEKALTADPDLAEARLRLGRVEWRLEHADAARTALDETLARTSQPLVRYLGHLYLGQLHEEAGRLEEAEREYRAALDVDPQAQAAAVALSYVLQLAGDPAASREVLARAVAQGGRRRRADAYWDYPLGRSAEAETLLEALREESRQ